MPAKGDSFIVELNNSHLHWGEHEPCRISQTRTSIDGEGYIPIPKKDAIKYKIFNSNQNGENTAYEVTAVNGNPINGKFLAQGCSEQGDVYAKQFSVQGDLKKLGTWFESVDAKPGGHVEICFTSSNSLTIKYLPKKQE